MHFVELTLKFSDGEASERILADIAAYNQWVEVSGRDSAAWTRSCN